MTARRRIEGNGGKKKSGRRETDRFPGGGAS
jgi:hypothetical protein